MEDEGTAEATFACRACGPLPRSKFHKSCLERYIHRCIECTKAKNRNYFASNKEVFAAWRMRRRASGGLQISRVALGEILDRFGRRCHITGLPGPLTLVPADLDLPFAADNAIPVLAKIAKQLASLQASPLLAQRCIVAAAFEPNTAAVEPPAPPPPPASPQPAMVVAAAAQAHDDPRAAPVCTA